jgi:hypothetical protein
MAHECVCAPTPARVDAEREVYDNSDYSAPPPADHELLAAFIASHPQLAGLSFLQSLLGHARAVTPTKEQQRAARVTGGALNTCVANMADDNGNWLTVEGLHGGVEPVIEDGRAVQITADHVLDIFHSQGGVGRAWGTVQSSHVSAAGGVTRRWYTVRVHIPNADPMEAQSLDLPMLRDWFTPDGSGHPPGGEPEEMHGGADNEDDPSGAPSTALTRDDKGSHDPGGAEATEIAAFHKGDRVRLTMARPSRVISPDGPTDPPAHDVWSGSWTVKTDAAPDGAGRLSYWVMANTRPYPAILVPQNYIGQLHGGGGTGESSYHEAGPLERDAGTGATASRVLSVGDHVWCRPHARSAAHVLAVVTHIYHDGTAAVTFPESIDPTRRERVPLEQLSPLIARRAAFDR